MFDEFYFLNMGLAYKKLRMREYAQLMEKTGLRLIELDILHIISLSGADNTASDITSLSHISKAHISKSVENLRRAGYVKLKGDGEDRRRLHISLTKTSAEVLSEYAASQKRLVRAVTGGLSDAQRFAAEDIIEKLLKNIEESLAEEPPERS